MMSAVVVLVALAEAVGVFVPLVEEAFTAQAPKTAASATMAMIGRLAFRYHAARHTPAIMARIPGKN